MVSAARGKQVGFKMIQTIEPFLGTKVTLKEKIGNLSFWARLFHFGLYLKKNDYPLLQKTQNMPPCLHLSYQIYEAKLTKSLEVP
jgi:hypothetical protein